MEGHDLSLHMVEPQHHNILIILAIAASTLNTKLGERLLDSDWLSSNGLIFHNICHSPWQCCISENNVTEIQT